MNAASRVDEMTRDLPFVSIIIPTHNRPQPLADCLSALTRLDYPRECLEVIVVDDGSAIALDSVVAQFSDALEVRLIEQRNAGPAAARNVGAASARGKLLAFTDDDCAPDANWLRALTERALDSPDCAIGGRALNALRGNPFSAASQTLICYLYAYYNADPHCARFFASNNLMVPADRFCAVGGFNAGFMRAAAEDREFCDRWQNFGYRMVYASDAIVYHTHRLTLRTFWRQHFAYGQGAYHFRRARAQRSRQPVALEPFGFYAGLLAYPFRQTDFWRSITLALLLVVSQTANALGFLSERFARVPSQMPRADSK